MNKNFKNIQKGFTLIEILVVIGIIAVLAAIVIIAINPARQFAQARNSQRESNITTILNAVGQNIADNKGLFGGVCGALLPASTASSSISNGTAGTLPAGAPSTAINLGCLSPTYIPSFPSDPNNAYAINNYTGYDISVDGTGRIMVCASQAAEAAIVGSTGKCVKR